MIEKDIENQILKAKKEGKKVGLVQGSWDLFHLGHLKYIKKAKELCDFLIVAMDSDEKIKKRKGPNRPVIPEEERYEFIKLLGIADAVVIKQVGEVKWGLIKSVKPDVLVAIKENYSDEEIEKLKEYCKSIEILPRQSTSSTSDKIRKMMISNQKNKIEDLDVKLYAAINQFKSRIDLNNIPQHIVNMVEYLSNSTDWICPVSCALNHNGNWYYGSNQVDFNIPKYDLEKRTELFFATIEHAEINLLKKIENCDDELKEIWVTLFPCDKCMKVLASKGIKKIYYFEDHEERNWSKRSHEMAKKFNIETIKLTKGETDE